MPRKRPLLPLAALLLLLLASSTISVVDAARKHEVAPLTPEAVEAEAAAVAEDAALMGKMFPMVSKLFMRKGKGLSFSQVVGAVTDLVDEREFVLFATVGWGLVPLTQGMYEVYANVTGRGLLIVTDDEEEAEGEAEEAKRSKLRKAYEGMKLTKNRRKMDDAGVEVSQQKRRMKPFHDTKLYQVVNHVSQASKIGLAVIGVDCISLISRMMGYNPWNIMERASRIFSKTIYTGWITYRLQVLKRYFLRKAFRHGRYGSEEMIELDTGKLNVVDNLTNGVISLVWLFYMLNYLEVEAGVAVKSLFSVGATGTLVFGLASKDIATQLISGLTLHLSDKIFEGDDVRFHDGTSGKIEKMGWFETMIRNSDELLVGIPNTQLSGQRAYNLSRTPRSQVKQDLRVSYGDAAKIPKLLEAIKAEIKQACPKLITDGSRPFRAHWRDYKDDHLQVVVDCHFKIKPTGNEYWDNRQRMLEAIDRAARKAGVQFERLLRVGV